MLTISEQESLQTTHGIHNEGAHSSESGSTLECGIQYPGVAFQFPTKTLERMGFCKNGERRFAISTILNRNSHSTRGKIVRLSFKSIAPKHRPIMTASVSKKKSELQFKTVSFRNQNLGENQCFYARKESQSCRVHSKEPGTRTESKKNQLGDLLDDHPSSECCLECYNHQHPLSPSSLPSDLRLLEQETVKTPPNSPRPKLTPNSLKRKIILIKSTKGRRLPFQVIC